MTPEFRFRDGDPTPTDIDAMYDYIALCEDEIDLRLNGYLTDRTWTCWAGYISTVFCNDQRYAKLLDRIPHDRYPSLRRFLALYPKSHKDADPRSELTLREKIRDLTRF